LVLCGPRCCEGDCLLSPYIGVARIIVIQETETRFHVVDVTGVCNWPFVGGQGSAGYLMCRNVWFGLSYLDYEGYELLMSGPVDLFCRVIRGKFFEWDWTPDTVCGWRGDFLAIKIRSDVER
jgi:hypothetical protein